MVQRIGSADAVAIEALIVRRQIAGDSPKIDFIRQCSSVFAGESGNAFQPVMVPAGAPPTADLAHWEYVPLVPDRMGWHGAARMRTLLALVLGIYLLPPAGAAPAHHARIQHRDHVISRSGQDVPVPPGWYKFPGYPPIPPEQNRNLDPSNFGGG